MLRVRVTTSFPYAPLARQTPGRTGAWGQFQFIIDQPVEGYDFWVLCDRFGETLRGRCAPANTIFVSAEPPSLAHYAKPFIAQFGTVVTCHRYIHGKNVIYAQQGIPWDIGLTWDLSKANFHALEPREVRLDYDQLKTVKFEKTKLISVITSARRGTRGHAMRYDFVQRLRVRLGERIDVFGSGIREVADKLDGLAPYKYHVALENSSVRDYWTEKLADPFLGGAFPIYHGCPNIEDYFSPQSMRRIDISDAEKAIDEIEAVIAAGEYERSLDRIAESRRLVLDEYNLFPMLAKLLSTMDPSAPKTDLEFKPLNQCEGLARRMARSVTRRLPPGLRRYMR